MDCYIYVTLFLDKYLTLKHKYRVSAYNDYVSLRNKQDDKDEKNMRNK